MERYSLVGLLAVVAAAVLVGGWTLLGQSPSAGPQEAKAKAVAQAGGGCCGGPEMALPTEAATGTTPAKSVSGKVVNTRCPIMGGAVDPNNVPKSLTREFRGQTVGFCCGGGPGQWDKLSDADKEAKLKAVSSSK